MIVSTTDAVPRVLRPVPTAGARRYAPARLARGVARPGGRLIRRRADGAVGELALSLKPPKWLRNIGATVARAVGVSATVPTPAGPVTVDTRDPGTFQDLRNAVARTSVTVGPRETPSPGDLIQQQLPGGYFTVGLGLLALGALALAATRKGR